jgi:gas vesicle protein
MKNPFEKNDHKVLIAGIIIGSVAAGAAAYLFLTETGSSVRQEIAGHFGRIRDAFMGNEPELVVDHEPEYLQHPKKKAKTDREALLKHVILGGEHHEESHQQS